MTDRFQNTRSRIGPYGPLPGTTVSGRLLEVGEVLQEDDVYESTTGEWVKCPCPGLTLATTHMRWVRPLTKEQRFDGHSLTCPDPLEFAGKHLECPCEHCMDTGFLSADPDEIECDCGAEFQPEAEMLAECARLREVGFLSCGIFRPGKVP